MRFVINEHQSSVICLYYNFWSQQMSRYESFTKHCIDEIENLSMYMVIGEPFNFAWFIFVSKFVVKRVDIPLSQA